MDERGAGELEQLRECLALIGEDVGTTFREALVVLEPEAPCRAVRPRRNVGARAVGDGLGGVGNVLVVAARTGAVEAEAVVRAEVKRREVGGAAAHASLRPIGEALP